MYLSLLPVSLLLSLAAAQTTTSQSVISVTSAAAGTASVCAAQAVLEACLASTEAIAAGCSSTDYQCLCEQWNNVLTYASSPKFLPLCLLTPFAAVSTTAPTTPDIPQFSQARKHTVTTCLSTSLLQLHPSPAPSPLLSLLRRLAPDLQTRRLRALLERLRLGVGRRALLLALRLERAVREAT
jgi:hypothetical protein